MKKIRIAILGASDIAYRRFLPALLDNEKFEYVGVATRDKKKAEKFIENYGGRIFESYDEVINTEDIDAIYVPLPPALHSEWALKGIVSGKHIMLEKPFTTSLKSTEEIIQQATQQEVVIHENYMFMFHQQLAVIKRAIEAGEIGELRLIRTSFGFPHRGTSDFRYNKTLGGGALLDCGGYPVKLANFLLGPTTEVATSVLYMDPTTDIDVYGNATLINDKGVVAQIAFGMDNAYKCQLEVWGSEGEIIAPRIFTAPADMDVEIQLIKQGKVNVLTIDQDDQFQKSIQHFYDTIDSPAIMNRNVEEIRIQAKLVEDISNNSKLYTIDRRSNHV